MNKNLTNVCPTCKMKNPISNKECYNCNKNFDDIKELSFIVKNNDKEKTKDEIFSLIKNYSERFEQIKWDISWDRRDGAKSIPTKYDELNMGMEAANDIENLFSFFNYYKTFLKYFEEDDNMADSFIDNTRESFCKLKEEHKFLIDIEYRKKLKRFLSFALLGLEKLKKDMVEEKIKSL